MAPDTHSPPLIYTQLLGRAPACDWHPAREGSGTEGLRTVGSEVSSWHERPSKEAGGAAQAADALVCGKGWQTRVWTWMVGRWPPGAQPGLRLRA